MAEILDEFDDATPLKSTYCNRITADEYEDLGEMHTEQALRQLQVYLNENPEAYFKVLKKKDVDETEDSGIISFFTSRFRMFFGGEDSRSNLTQMEMKEKLDKLKGDILKAHEYSQESKGRRISRRLAAKKCQKVTKRTMFFSPSLSPSAPSLLPPPPPPLPPVAHTSTPASCPHPILTRRPLTDSRVYGNCGTETSSSQCIMAVGCVQKSGRLKKRTDLREAVMDQLKGSGGRKRLRRVAENRSPGGTPLGGWPKQPNSADIIPYFNVKLVDKFKNAALSPASTTASPQSFA